MSNADPSPAVPSPLAYKSRFHRGRQVKPHHASGSWTVCIGKALSRDGSKLVRRDFYFAGVGEAEANERANALQREWEFLVTNWEHLYGSRLRNAGKPFADIPHWQRQVVATSAASAFEPTQAEIDAIQNRPPTAEDYIDQYANVSLLGVYSLFEQAQLVKVMQGDVQQTTQRALMKSLRAMMKHFDPGLRMSAMTHAEIQTAKTKLLGGVGRRTAKNHLANLRRMLKWFYESDYGQGHDKPTHFDEVFTVKNATRTDVKTYAPAMLGDILTHATERERLYVMLGLNCGMYQADIGRLTLDEIDADAGWVYWDREKEPQNPFRVRHELWPETQRLVLQFIQGKGTPTRLDTDWRDGKATQVDCSALAFVDDAGKLIYRITEGGRAYDKIGKAVDRLNERLKKKDLPTFSFRSLRKSTNQLLCEHLENRVGDDDTQGMLAVGEISNMFLGQKNKQLDRLYKNNGHKMYGRMNRELKAVGDQLRAAGVFNCLG